MNRLRVSLVLSVKIVSRAAMRQAPDQFLESDAQADRFVADDLLGARLVAVPGQRPARPPHRGRLLDAGRYVSSPVRVSTAEVERRVAGLDRFGERRREVPTAVLALAKAQEAVGAPTTGS